MSNYRLCIVIPVYNHREALRKTLAEVSSCNVECIAVDDGSTDGSLEELLQLAQQNSWLEVLRRKRNGGKGAALLDGFRLALERGFTHALTVDADGQHDLSAFPAIEQELCQYPRALLLGRPVFDSDAPLERRIFRELSNFFTWVAALSFAPRDALCGFRVYPLQYCGEILLSDLRGHRMDFDPEALVRILWAGIPVRNIPVQVRYPEDGVSHFRYLHDNVLLFMLFARLILGMILRCPVILWRRVRSLDRHAPIQSAGETATSELE